MLMISLLTWFCCVILRKSDAAAVTTTEATRRALLDQLFSHYDKTLAPNFGTDQPSSVIVQMYIVSFDSVHASTMDFKISIYLRIWWKDQRLAYNSTKALTKMTFTESVVRRFWIPDIFFTNEKQGSFHHVLQQNQAIELESSGNVFLTTRVSLRLACDMNLRDFPLDIQKCGLNIMSYAYSTKKIILRWRQQPCVLRKNLQIPQFHLVKQLSDEGQETYSIGNYSVLSLSFILKREIGYYFTQAYLPSILTVSLSWVSFWISHESVPARITLGLLTVLTMTTLFTGIYSSLPKVSYLKAIDLWTSVCLLLVFAALLEFAAVNVLSRSLFQVRDLKNARWNMPDRRRTPRSVKEEFLSRRTSRTIPSNGVSVDSPDEEQEESLNSEGEYNRASKKAGQFTALLIDKVSRIAFPAAFLGFNLFYWFFYMTPYSNAEVNHSAKISYH